MSWFCSQIGAREHYAIPRVLHRTGRLASFYTDFWAGKGVRALAGGTHAKNLRSLAARFHPDLAKAPVTSWNIRALSWEAGLRGQKGGEVYKSFEKIGGAFSECVREALKKRKDRDKDSVFFAYDTGALETLEWCRERGVYCIVNQIDPNRVEVRSVREEEKHWPGWTIQTDEVPEEYFRRREKEWALADCVVVNSEFCRQALIEQGVPPEKLTIVPLCYEPENRGQRTDNGSSRKAGRLCVLFLGQVILRKGIQYLVQAAKLLENEPLQFDVIGPIGISEAAIASTPRNVKFHGRATRDQIANWYRQSDIFVIPTLSDGFAITQLEAMSYGLPVVATPCCGAVVSDGADGFIVPPRDASTLAKLIHRYLSDKGLLQSQSNAALTKSRHFTMDRLATNLRNLENKMHPCFCSS